MKIIFAFIGHLVVHFSVYGIPHIDVTDGIDPIIDAEERWLAHRVHATFLKNSIWSPCNAVFHQTKFAKFLDVGSVASSGDGIHGDHETPLALFDEVQDDVVADPRISYF